MSTASGARALAYDKVGEWHYRLRSHSSYEPPVSRPERNVLVDLYARCFGGTLFDGETVRLDGIREGQPVVFDLAPITFFDFVATTLAWEHLDELEAFARTDTARPSAVPALESLRRAYARLRRFDSLPQLVRCRQLANALAVSVQVQTADGRYIIARRTQRVIVAKGWYSVSATGAVDLVDCSHGDPFLNAARRELEEELGLAVPLEALRLRGLAAGVGRMQPTALVDAAVDLTADAVLSAAARGVDYRAEVGDLLAMRKAELRDILSKGSFAEADRLHLEHIAT